MFQKIAQQTVIQVLGKILSLLLGLAVVALMTRALGPEGYGQYTTVIAFLQLTSLLTGFGLSMTVGRELGSGVMPANTLLGNALSFRAITAGVAFAAAPVAAGLLGYPQPLILSMMLVSVGFWAGSITQTITSVFQAKLKSGWLTSVDITSRLVLLAGTGWAAYTLAPLNTYLSVFVLANLLALLLYIILARRLISFTWQFDLNIWRILWVHTWPIALTTTLNVIYFKADTVILSLFRPAAEVGFYGAAYTVLEVLLAFPAILGGLLLPQIAQARADGQHEEVKRLYRGAADALLAAGVAVIAGAALVGRPLMSVIAGSNFAITGDILAVLSLAIMCSFVGNAAGYAIFAIKEQKRLIKVFAAGAVLGFTAYLIFIPVYSYWGAAWVTVGVEALVNLAMVTILWHRGVPLSFKRWPKILLATLALAVGLAAPLDLWLKLVLGLGLYGLVLWKTNLLSDYTKNSLTQQSSAPIL
ncbi:MAG: flippase [Candidatus Kerfeldbacteria bacterium]|nr:flippase [Candidatus Kerfeldbacteria bacterium]